MTAGKTLKSLPIFRHASSRMAGLLPSALTMTILRKPLRISDAMMSYIMVIIGSGSRKVISPGQHHLLHRVGGPHGGEDEHREFTPDRLGRGAHGRRGR